MKITSRFLIAIVVAIVSAGVCEAQILRRTVMRPPTPRVLSNFNFAMVQNAQARAQLLSLAQQRASVLAMNPLSAQAQAQLMSLAQQRAKILAMNPSLVGANFAALHRLDADLLRDQLNRYPLYGTGYVAAYPAAMASYPSTGYGSSYPSMGYGPSYPSSGYSASMPNGGYDYLSSLLGGVGSEYGPLPDAGYGGANKSPDTATKPVYNTALIEVKVPLALADVVFEGQKTKETGTTRRLRTPALVPNQLYTFTVQANWTEDGVARNPTRHVQVAAGQTVVVDFTKGE